MSKLDVRAEITKLAREFELPEASLEFLHKLEPDKIRDFRSICQEKLFNEYVPIYERIARASGLLPAPMVIKIGETVFSPYLSARIATQLPVNKALKFAELSSTDYLARVCETIDPSRVRAVIQGVPLQKTGDVFERLLATRDFITLGKFIDTVTLEQIETLLSRTDDSGALLQIAFYTEGKHRLEEISRLLDEETLSGIVEYAATNDLFVEAFALMEHLSEDSRRRIVNITANLGDAALTAFIETAEREALWGDVLPLVFLMSDENQIKTMHIPAVVPCLPNMIQAAYENEIFAELLELMGHAEPELLDHVAHHMIATEGEVFRSATLAAVGAGTSKVLVRISERVVTLSDDKLGRLTTTLHEQELWAPYLPVFLEMATSVQVSLLKTPQFSEIEKLQSIVVAVYENQMMEPLLSLLEHAEEDLLATIAGLDSFFEADVINAAVEAGLSAGKLHVLAAILNQMEAQAVEKGIANLTDELKEKLVATENQAIKQYFVA